MADPRPKCAYWATCYRKNPTHLAQFRHPADDDASDAAATPAVPAPKPKLKAVASVVSVVAAAAKTKTKAAVAEEDAEMKDASESRKRPREESTDSKPILTKAAPAAAAAAAASSAAAAASSSPKPPASPKAASSSSASPAPAAGGNNSAADAVFELKDSEWSEETLNLWREFHTGCWAASCPSHSKPSSRSFFEIGAALLKSLYGGLEFPQDLWHFFRFVVEEQEKMGGGVKMLLDGGGETQGEESSDAAAAAASSSSTSSSSSSLVDSACIWQSSSHALLHLFAPLLNLALIGPFKILCGHFRTLISPVKLHPFLLDRFFYDSPEVWSVLQQLPASGGGSSEDEGVHWAYYRDDPRAEHPPTFVGRLTEKAPAVTLVGPNLFSTLMAIIDERMEETGGASAAKKKKLDPSQTTLDSSSSAVSSDLTLSTLRTDLELFAKKHCGYTLTLKGGKRASPKTDAAWKKREKQVVCDLDNKVGLVVPYAEDIGWRPVNCENAELTKIVLEIEKAKYSGRKINYDALDHLVTLTAYANDERDPGMGIELALNLMAKSKTHAINSDICRLLSLGYQLVDRNLYSDVIELHMRHRAKHISQIGKGRFAKPELVY